MAGVTTSSRGRVLTRADLEAMPDDGRRHELIDGALLVTPAPGSRHQAVVANLLVVLHAACPPDLRVRPAPFDVTLADDSVVQPDLLVARAADIDEHGLAVAPLLVVEVLSPATRLVDLHLKRARYAQAAVPSYWVVDPADTSLVAWQLRHGAYAAIARVVGDEVFVADRPFATRITPGDLVD
jgi:Uma2 family endonuclease